MKNKAPIIFLIILLSIMIFGLVMFLVVSLSGGKARIINWGSKNSNIIYNETFDLEEIKNIEIIQDAGEITFKEASDDKITVIAYGEETEDIQATLNESKLTVDNTNKNKFIFLSFGNIKNDIIVYIPTNYEGKVKIENDMGNCVISNLEKATIEIDCDAGNVEIEKAKNANVKCNLGQVTIEEILNSCNISVDSGNLEIEKLTINENSKIKVDLGNITIDETNDIYIDANVDLGNANINGNNKNSEITLKIECDCGNINVGR